MKKYLILIILVYITLNQEAHCVEHLSLIQKKAILIEIIKNEYPEIKNQAYDYIFVLNEIISIDLSILDTKNQIRKYAVFIRYLCFITSHNYDVKKGYICEISDLINCHNRHIDNWCNVFS